MQGIVGRKKMIIEKGREGHSHSFNDLIKAAALGSSDDDKGKKEFFRPGSFRSESESTGLGGRLAVNWWWSG